jgi:TolB-like protein/Tfp pilus assembly protein PilF
MIKALQAAEKAVAIDESNASAHLNLGFVYSWRKQHDKAIAENERAVELEPGASGMWFGLGRALDYACRHEEAVEMFKKAIRMGPLGNTAYYFHLGNAYFNVGRYEEGITAHKKALEFSPNNFAAHRGLTACYAQLGLHDEASFHAKELLKYSPKFSVAEYIRRAPWNDSALTERWANALRKAGLPETPPLPLPDKPSIAVLPFVNMSDDPKQEYFSDGITEEIITALSKTPKLFVIARNSTFTYKNKPTKVQKVGRELGVKYVLEGSVRKAGDKVRVTAQLVDAQTGNHIWAERYDRELKDIFVIQDDITKKIITALQVELTEGEQARIWSKGTANIEAYLLCIQGMEQIRRMNKDGTVRSRQMAEKAIALDPNYALAYRLLANTYAMEVPLRLTKNPRQSIARATKLTQKALALDESLASAHSLLGWLYTLMRQHDKGIQECERGVALEPNSANAHFFLNLALRYAGRAKEAITMCKEAIRLDPIPMSHYYQGLTNAYCLAGQYEEAITAGIKAVHLEPNNLIAHAFLAAAYILGGMEEEALAEAKEVLRINPRFSVEQWAKTMPYKNQADRDLVINALRKAGLK